MNELPTLMPGEQTAPTRWLSLLSRYGLVVAPAWTSDAQLSSLLAEHECAFAQGSASVREVPYRPATASRALRLTNSQAHEFPQIQAFLSHTTLKVVAAHYLGVSATVHQFAYLTRDVADPSPVTAIHYDRKHALKAYLCLTEARPGWGAPAFVPASHWRSRMIREKYLAAGVSPKDLPITTGHEGNIPVPLEGPAGTLVVFDTDCLHQGGIVDPGNVRRVLRGHSHPLGSRFD